MCFRPLVGRLAVGLISLVCTVNLAAQLPGEFLVKTKHPAPYNYPYFMMSYNFF